MNSVKQLVEEHDHILVFTQILQAACLVYLETGELATADFRQMVDFGRHYADGLHHQKEEEILFQRMIDTLGPVADKLVRGGMLVEHDLGRLYVQQLEQALDQLESQPDNRLAALNVLGNAVAYRDLLVRHIDKENDVVFPYAENHLSPAHREWVEKETTSYESQEKVAGQRQHYLGLLTTLQQKYLP